MIVRVIMYERGSVTFRMNDTDFTVNTHTHSIYMYTYVCIYIVSEYIYIYIFVYLWSCMRTKQEFHTKGEFTIGGTNRNNRDDCEVVEESVAWTRFRKTIGWKWMKWFFFFVRLFVIEFWEHCREGRGCIEFDTRGKNIGIVFGDPFRTRVCLRSLRWLVTRPSTSAPMKIDGELILIFFEKNNFFG